MKESITRYAHHWLEGLRYAFLAYRECLTESSIVLINYYLLYYVPVW